MSKLKPEVLAYIKQQTTTGITLTKNQKGINFVKNRQFDKRGRKII